MEEDKNLEIIDVENYRGSKDQQFSHQMLVMKVMARCIETGAKEMRSGYYNEKSDKFGNKLLVYIPDTRKEFIESVKTAMMIMACDMDKEAKEAIDKIKTKLNAEFKQLCLLEEKDWEQCPTSIRRERWAKGIFQQKGSLNVKLPYYQEYIEYEIDCCRDMLAELTKLTRRLHFYEEEEYEA